MKTKPKNLKEFKALIERYESITLDEIKKNWDWAFGNPANNLTGFGGYLTCTLCKKIRRHLYETNEQCHLCVYGLPDGCISFKNAKTYYKIKRAQSPKKLLNAFRCRARRMRKILEELK